MEEKYTFKGIGLEINGTREAKRISFLLKLWRYRTKQCVGRFNIWNWDSIRFKALKLFKAEAMFKIILAKVTHKQKVKLRPKEQENIIIRYLMQN